MSNSLKTILMIVGACIAAIALRWSYSNAATQAAKPTQQQTSAPELGAGNKLMSVEDLGVGNTQAGARHAPIFTHDNTPTSGDFKVLERHVGTSKFYPWVDLILFHDGKRLHARCNNVKGGEDINNVMRCKLQVGDIAQCQAFADRLSDDAGGYDLICGDDRQNGKLITSGKNELIDIAEYDEAYKAREEAELAQLPKRPLTIIYDEWWSSDYAANGAGMRCAPTMLEMCKDEARGQEAEFFGRLSGAFQSDPACAGMRMVSQHGLKQGGEDMNSTREAEALSEAETREHLFLMVSFVPDHPKQSWSIQHFAAMDPHGLADRSAEGENDAFSMAHAVCRIAQNRGGSVVQ